MALAIKQVRDKENGGIIKGKEAAKIGMSIAVVALVILSAWWYFEFEWKIKELSVQYYNGKDYLEFLKRIPKVKAEDYPKIIEENIAALSAFKAVTAKLFSFLFVSISGAFMCAVFLKKS